MIQEFPYLYALDLLGTLVFAISGFLTASDKKFDLFGAAVISLVTALGGGTIRDMLIGSHPIGVDDQCQLPLCRTWWNCG